MEHKIIPKRLNDVLEGQPELETGVRQILHGFLPWLAESGMPFFQEYTRHDDKHVADVLATTEALISEAAWEIITPDDVAVLIVSVLFHDAALHLNEQGFVQLVAGHASHWAVEGIGDAPWSTLWEEFIEEAQRFDQRKLFKIFGDTTPVHRPKLDAETFTGRDKRLIGEFLRRWHHRLAHEFSLWGIPSETGKKLEPKIDERYSYLLDMSGVVARSHGMSIRQLFPYLEKKYDNRQFKRIHPVWLMSLIRIADYLQIAADRAPSYVLQVLRLRCPVSQGEWDAHHAIRDVRNTHEDPEAIFIDALPSDARTFFKIEEWLTGIQSELDSSWAVLGEVYGRYPELAGFGVTIRRVRSNLEDKIFVDSLPFSPIRAELKSAGAELIKLLIEPLYGNRPEIWTP